jgi:hypothetical protein
MGTSKSPLELAAKCFAAAKVIETAATVGVEKGAKVLAEAERVAFPSRLRGVGKSGRALGAAVKGGKYESGAKFLVFMTGPAGLVNFDTPAHQIPRQRSSASFEGVFGHAVIPNGAEGGVHGRGGVRTKVMAPGTRGKHLWEKTEAEVLPGITAVIGGATVEALGGIF